MSEAEKRLKNIDEWLDVISKSLDKTNMTLEKMLKALEKIERQNG